MPIALALGGFALIDDGNPDFDILGHSPVVVAALIGLVALTAPAMAVVDGWLDRRLPRPASPRSRSGAAYLVVAGAGMVLAALVIVSSGATRSSSRCSSR